MYGVWVLRSLSPHGVAPPEDLVCAPFYVLRLSSRGTEPRQGETVPVDMFIISTSKPLLRFSGLDVGPPAPVPHPSVRAPLQANKIRGTKGPDEQVAWNTSNGPNLFTFSRNKSRLSSRDNCVTLWQGIAREFVYRVGDEIGLRKFEGQTRLEPFFTFSRDRDRNLW